jgi:hypothetical protein
MPGHPAKGVPSDHGDRPHRYRPVPVLRISDGIQQTSDQRLHGGAAHFWKTSRNRSRAA